MMLLESDLTPFGMFGDKISGDAGDGEGVDYIQVFPYDMYRDDELSDDTLSEVELPGDLF
jgi:hypothetical protein